MVSSLPQTTRSIAVGSLRGLHSQTKHSLAFCLDSDTARRLFARTESAIKLAQGKEISNSNQAKRAPIVARQFIFLCPPSLAIDSLYKRSSSLALRIHPRALLSFSFPPKGFSLSFLKGTRESLHSRLLPSKEFESNPLDSVTLFLELSIKLLRAFSQLQGFQRQPVFRAFLGFGFWLTPNNPFHSITSKSLATNIFCFAFRLKVKQQDSHSQQIDFLSLVH